MVSTGPPPSPLEHRTWSEATHTDSTAEWASGGPRPLSRFVDQAQVAVGPAVEHGAPAGLGVGEEPEVVLDEVELSIGLRRASSA